MKFNYYKIYVSFDGGTSERCFRQKGFDENDAVARLEQRLNLYTVDCSIERVIKDRSQKPEAVVMDVLYGEGYAEMTF